MRELLELHFLTRLLSSDEAFDLHRTLAMGKIQYNREKYVSHEMFCSTYPLLVSFPVRFLARGLSGVSPHWGCLRKSNDFFALATKSSIYPLLRSCFRKVLI